MQNISAKKKRFVGIRNFIKAVVFVLLTAGVLCTLSYILRPYSGSASRKNLCGFYAEEDNTLDIVFVGSSAVFAFWEPMEFWNDYGITSYNFATGSMPPQMIKYCLKEIQKTQDPRLYVIDLRPFSVAEDGYYQEKEIMNMEHDTVLRNVSDNFKYSLNRYEMIKECVPDSYDKIPYYFDLMKYHTEWTRLFDRQSLEYGTNSSHDSSKGFKMVNSVKQIEPTDYASDENRRPLSERLDPILYDLLDYCEEENLQVLFLVSAYRQPKKSKETFNYISDVVAGYGYDFLNTNDYYEEIGLDFNTEFYDKNHVNIFGADKYTDFVGKYILSRYSFEDKRDQKAYESWNEDYEIWSEDVRELKESIQKKIDAM
ncbi:MAG: hypothetical protein SOX32_12195 [Candidatus Choladocola sp.]|nr:hypothetical protein [Candidatus Choladocola sp.]